MKNEIYPWTEFLIEAAEPDDKEDKGTNEPVDKKEDADTGTNEPVSEGDEPDKDMAEDLTNPPSEAVDTGAQNEIEDLKKQIDELKKKFDIETEVEQLKKRLDNMSVVDEASLNDNINQSASSEIKYIKRALRRFLIKNKTAGLTGHQQSCIISELDLHPTESNQALAAKLSSEINASQQDIIDFIRSTDYRFRHRHRREASVIDWNEIK